MRVVEMMLDVDLGNEGENNNNEHAILLNDFCGNFEYSPTPGTPCASFFSKQ
jgi:hypothetical protein